MEKTIKILKKITWLFVISSILIFTLSPFFAHLWIKNQNSPKIDPKTGIELIQPYNSNPVSARDLMIKSSNPFIILTIAISIFDILIGCFFLFKNWRNLEKRAIIKKLIINEILIAIIFFIFYAIINTKMCCGGGGDPSL